MSVQVKQFRSLDRAFMLALRDSCRSADGFDADAFDRWLDVFACYPMGHA